LTAHIFTAMIRARSFALTLIGQLRRARLVADV